MKKLFNFSNKNGSYGRADLDTLKVLYARINEADLPSRDCHALTDETDFVKLEKENNGNGYVLTFPCMCDDEHKIKVYSVKTINRDKSLLNNWFKVKIRGNN